MPGGILVNEMAVVVGGGDSFDRGCKNSAAKNLKLLNNSPVREKGT